MLPNKFTPELIAPCGMNCALCKAYIAYSHGIPRQRGKVTHCAGCLSRAKNCFIKRGCTKLSQHQTQSCHQCDVMPCKNLDRLDKRYRERYGMSMVENLKMLKAKGMASLWKTKLRSTDAPTAETRFVCMMENATLADT